ncbi:MAG: hypothetical protein KA444_00820 [Bacteroidia bacterium]|nr:hypothetical protein [Bacteroidia bacterium]
MKGFYTLHARSEHYFKLPDHSIMQTTILGKIKVNGLPFLLYIIGLAIILPFTMWYVNNPDAFQYISLARKWSTGNFSTAVNGYWSPLISWLIAIPLSFGIGGIVSFKIVQIIVGFFTIHAWNRLLEMASLSKKYHQALQTIIVPFVLVYGMLNPTPDLLFMTLVFYSLIILLKKDWRTSWKWSIILAFIGAALFFTKAFGLPFFITIILVFGASQLLINKETKILQRLIAILSFSLSISCLWIVPLSMKYDQVTISKAASFNMSKEVAPMPGQIMKLPVLNGPLLNPPDTLAISAWEAPGDYLKLNPVSPLKSPENFDYYSELIKRNFLTIWYFDFRNQIGIIFLLIFFFFLFTKGIKVILENRLVVLLFATLIAFYFGYSLILVHTRYIWICSWLMLLLSTWMLEKIAGEIKWKVKISGAIFLVLLLVAVKRPIKEILFTQDSDMPFIWLSQGILNPIVTLNITYRPDKQLHETSLALAPLLKRRNRIASLQSDDHTRHTYSSSLFIAEALSAQYFGPLSDTLLTVDAEAQLKQYGISVFLVWDHVSWIAENENWVEKIYVDQDLGLKVYAIR